MKKRRMLMIFMAIIFTGFTVAGCKPEIEGIEPKIIEQLQTPCEGEISSVFKQTSSGWVLSVSCVDKEKLKKQRDQMREGLGQEIKPRTDGYDPLAYE